MFGRRLGPLHALALAVFVMQSGFGSILPILPLFVHEHGLSLPLMGIFAAAFQAGALLAQVPAGRLADTLGRLPVLRSGLMLSAACFLAYLLPLPPALIVMVRGVQGAATASVIPATNALVADLVAPGRRGRAYGLISGASMGGFVAGPVVGGLVGARFGLAVTVIVGALMGVCGLGASFAVPREKGRGAPPSPLPRPRVGPGPIFPLLALNFGWLGLVGMYDTVWSFFLRHLGASTFVIGLSWTLFALPAVLLSTLGGRLADRSRRLERRVLLGVGINACICLGYTLARDPAQAIVLGVLEGAMLSLVSPAFNVMLASRVGEAVLGEAQGMVAAAAALGALLEASVSGWLFSLDPVDPMLMGAGTMLVSLAAAAIGFRSRHWRRGAGAVTAPVDVGS